MCKLYVKNISFYMPKSTALVIKSVSPLCFPQMLKLCSELEMVVSCCEAKRDKLRETKELYVNF